MDNGSGTVLVREFCPTCGTGVLEYGVCSDLLLLLLSSFGSSCIDTCPVGCSLVYPCLMADWKCVCEGEQEPAEPHFRYIMTGTLDQPDALPPKGEFFCKNRSAWMPEVPGECLPGGERVE